MLPARMAEQALHVDTGYYILSYLYFSHFSVSDLIAMHPQSVLVQKKSIPVIFFFTDFTEHKNMYEDKSNENLKVWEEIMAPLCSMSLA